MKARAKSAIGYALAALALAGCAESIAFEPPPKEQFYFPVGVATHPAGFAVVVNSNFDLRYAHGSLQFVDLKSLEERVVAGEGLTRDHTDLILAEPQISVPNFGGSVAVSGDAEHGLAAVACRQTSQVMLVDLELDGGGELQASCGPDGEVEEGYVECQGARNLLDLDEEDPFGLMLLENEEAGAIQWSERSWSLWVSFLGSGELHLVDVPAGRPAQGDPLEVSGQLDTGADSVNDMALSPRSGFIYATSRYNDYYSNPLYYIHPLEGKARSFDLYGVLLGNQTRGLGFLPDGLTLALAVRDPDMLVFVDTSVGPDGLPVHSIEGLADLDNLPARVFASGDLVLVSDAEDDSISVIDSRTRRLLERREDICRGPFDFALWEGEQVTWVLVTCFEENLLAVLDIDSASASFLQVVARVGKPKVEEW